MIGWILYADTTKIYNKTKPNTDCSNGLWRVWCTMTPAASDLKIKWTAECGSSSACRYSGPMKH